MTNAEAKAILEANAVPVFPLQILYQDWLTAIHMAEEALEKQTPKTPNYEGDGYSDGVLVYDTWICSCCGKDYEVDCDDYKYCPECGQRIDWSEGE